jgi:nitrite reductase (NADH) small subunit
MAFVKIGPLRALPPGSSMHAILGEGGGQEAVAVCNVAGQLYAMDGICPHSGGPLGHGALEGHMLACPFHGWEFDCRDGSSPVDDHLKLATYRVKVEAGEILVEMPSEKLA